MKDSHRDDTLMTLSDVAQYLKMSKSSVYKNWKKMGIRPVIAWVGAPPRFWKSDVLRLIDQQK